MAIEIEAKIKVAELTGFARTLKELGAEFRGERSQKDIFFDKPDGDLIQRGCGLRLRQEIGAGIQKSQLCFKGPVQKNASLKQRREIEVAVTDPQQAQNLLEALGFSPIMAVEKRRALWRLDGCDVCLDEVAGLGCFVEIEGPDENQINQTAKKLAIDVSGHIPDSYARMLKKTQNEY